MIVLYSIASHGLDYNPLGIPQRNLSRIAHILAVEVVVVRFPSSVVILFLLLLFHDSLPALL